MKPVVLLTDFGTKDGHVGVMKGVILRIAPTTPIIDLSHGIQPQNIGEAALILSRNYHYFPDGSIFIAVIDPGVGTARRPICAQIGEYWFVLPDNGIITPILDEAQKNSKPVTIIHLTEPSFWNDHVSPVFHGRDIFAPVAAHLATGRTLSEMGAQIQDPVRFYLKRPHATGGKLVGEIIHIDHFGNISTNIRTEDLGETKRVQLNYRNHEIAGLYHTFGDAEIGSLIAFIGSTGSLIIGKVNGNAAHFLSASYGDPIEVIRLD